MDGTAALLTTISDFAGSTENYSSARNELFAFVRRIEMRSGGQMQCEEPVKCNAMLLFLLFFCSPLLPKTLCDAHTMNCLCLCKNYWSYLALSFSLCVLFDFAQVLIWQTKRVLHSEMYSECMHAYCVCVWTERTQSFRVRLRMKWKKEDGARWRSFKSGIRDAFGGVKRDTCICEWRLFAAPLTVQLINSTAIDRQSTQSGRIECGIAINKQFFRELERNRMEKQEQLVANPRRNILRMAVANILTETGFGKADKQCVESLTEVRYH